MLAKKAREVLDLLDEQGLLQDLVLIGSWSCYFYTYFFSKEHYIPSIQTVDMDFLIPSARRIDKPIDLPAILKTLDFDSEFNIDGWLRFVHPELRVEFLVPRLGPQSNDPRKIPQLSITAMPLRHMHPLIKHAITIKDKGLTVRVSHPLTFALHKLFVSKRRKDKGKAFRDKDMALRILEAIQVSNKKIDFSAIWSSFTNKEQKIIRTSLLDENKDYYINVFDKL